MTLSHRAHIDLLSSPGSVMLVSVATIRGSTPREAGAFMLIGKDGVSGTIGGGNLEHQVTRKVRDELAEAAKTDGTDSTDDAAMSDAEIVRFPLGPGLGQCCGGSVDVGFHHLGPSQKADLLAAFQKLSSGGVSPNGCWVTVPVTGNQLRVADDDQATVLANTFGALRGGMMAHNGADVLCLRLDDAVTPVWIFGAGHVGKALVGALSPLPFSIHMVDSRDDYLAELAGRIDEAGQTAGKLHLCQSDQPQDEVADIPPGAHVLILTHNHALDFDICRAALARNDLGFVGMIGSQTKRARFMRRLSDRGLSAAEIGRLTCPIGVSGITGKQPAVIAASVAVQLLTVREAQMAQNQPILKTASDGIIGR